MVSPVRFGNVAHIVVPKQAVDYAVMYEQRLAQGQDNKVWRKEEFPFDRRYAEALVLSGADLKAAGNTDSWDFGNALSHMDTRVKSDYTDCSQTAPMNGSNLLLGRTVSGGRAALYRHAPEKYRG